MPILLVIMKFHYRTKQVKNINTRVQPGTILIKLQRFSRLM